MLYKYVKYLLIFLILKELAASYTAVPSSPVIQALGHNIVLTDDLISFATPVDQTVSTSTLQVVSAMQLYIYIYIYSLTVLTMYE